VFNPIGSNGISANDECIFSQFVSTGHLTYSKAGTAPWQWHIASGAFATSFDTWYCAGITHDQTAPGVTPLMYIGGTNYAPTLSNPGSGSYPTSGGFTVEIGNRSTASDRIWDGMLGPLFMFDDPIQGLTASEHLALASDPSIIFDGMADDVWVPAAAAADTYLEDTLHRPSMMALLAF
jgi:hypothetical protein